VNVRAREVPAYWAAFKNLSEPLSDIEIRHSGRDASEVITYRSERADGPTILLISPPESPFLLVSPLYVVLSDKFSVLAWDPVRATFMDCGPDDPVPSVRDHADQLRSVLESLDDRPTHLVTWCSGALTGLQYIADRPQSIASATFIAPPSLLSSDPERTAFQSGFIEKVLRMALFGAEERSRIYRQLRDGQDLLPETTVAEATLKRLTGMLWQSEARATRYARSILLACTPTGTATKKGAETGYRETLRELARNVPVSVIHSSDDQLVSLSNARAIARENPEVQLRILNHGGHFAVHTCADELAELVLEGISSRKQLPNTLAGNPTRHKGRW